MLNRKDKISALDKVMRTIQEIEQTDGYDERDLVDILEMAAKLALPHNHISLEFKLF